MRLLRLFKRDLHHEARQWVTDGLIDTAQAEAICRRYGIDYHDQTQHSFGYYVLVALGYLFIGLAVIVLIGENWEDIPRAVRMGGLIGLTLACNGIGLVAWRREKRSLATLWFFLGGLMYGASIMLIAQIYHIGEHFPDGIFWWALGVFPLALLLGSNLIMLQAMTLAYLWFFVESNLLYFPAFFVVFLLALAWQTFRGKPSLLLFLALMAGIGLYSEYSLAWWLDDPGRYGFGPENIFIGAAVFVFYHGLAKWLGHQSGERLADYGTALEIWTLRFAIVGLFIFSFESSWKEILDAPWQLPGLSITLVLLLAAGAIALAWLGQRDPGKCASTLVFAGVTVGALIAVMSLGEAYADNLQVVDNLVLVITGIWLIAQGIRRGVTHYFYLGVFTVLATGLLRYIDLVGDYIGAAVLFAVFAAILLASARYWKKHLADMEVSS